MRCGGGCVSAGGLSFRNNRFQIGPPIVVAGRGSRGIGGSNRLACEWSLSLLKSRMGLVNLLLAGRDNLAKKCKESREEINITTAGSNCWPPGCRCVRRKRSTGGPPSADLGPDLARVMGLAPQAQTAELVASRPAGRPSAIIDHYDNDNDDSGGRRGGALATRSGVLSLGGLVAQVGRPAEG